MCVCLYLSVHYVHVVSAKARRGHQIPLELELQRIVRGVWVLGTEMRVVCSSLHRTSKNNRDHFLHLQLLSKTHGEGSI